MLIRDDYLHHFLTSQRLHKIYSRTFVPHLTVAVNTTEFMHEGWVMDYCLLIQQLLSNRVYSTYWKFGSFFGSIGLELWSKLFKNTYFQIKEIYIIWSKHCVGLNWKILKVAQSVLNFSFCWCISGSYHSNCIVDDMTQTRGLLAAMAATALWMI